MKPRLLAFSLAVLVLLLFVLGISVAVGLAGSPSVVTRSWGGNYQLEQIAPPALSGGSYRVELSAPAAPDQRGNGCCCVHLPCVYKQP